MSGITWNMLNDLLSYNPDTGIITYKVSKAGHVQAGREAGAYHRKGYRHIRIKNKLHLSHRVAWALHYNERPPKYIDHINGVGTDNRIANLRATTLTENARNRRTPCNSSSGVIGVNWNGKYWVARVRENGKCHYAGYHKDKESAISALELLRKKLHGEFYRDIRS